MKLVDTAAMDWLGGQEKHRGGGLRSKYLLAAEEGRPDDFRLVLGNGSEGDADSPKHTNPRHRHNFDQVRMAVKGAVSIAPGTYLEEGQIGYFPEGTYYGPQRGGRGEVRVTLVLQMGGISGSGFISTRQMQAGHAALLDQGSFEGGVFRRHTGDGRKNQDGFEAVWEQVQGRKLAYPPPRYDHAIIMTPANFAWRSEGESPGVARKHLGTFTERGTRIELIRLDGGARVQLGSADARWLVFAISGSGQCEGQDWSAHAAIQVEAGESASIVAAESAELLVIVLPSIKLLLTAMSGGPAYEAIGAERGV